MTGNSGRPFNPISGAELLELLLHDVRRQLSLDGRFRAHLVYPQVAYAVAIQVSVYPADSGPLAVELSGKVAPTGMAFPPGGNLAQIPEMPDPAHPGGFVEGHLQTTHRPATPELRQAARQAQASEILTPKVVEPVHEKHLNSAPQTQSGDTITGGAKEPPGFVQDLAARHRKANADRLVAERAAAGDPVDASRVIVNPDAARRDAGLPVPKPTKIDGGHVVDLPSDQF